MKVDKEKKDLSEIADGMYKTLENFVNTTTNEKTREIRAVNGICECLLKKGYNIKEDIKNNIVTITAKKSGQKTYFKIVIFIASERNGYLEIDEEGSGYNRIVDFNIAFFDLIN